MVVQTRSIHNKRDYEYEYSFCTLVTNPTEYQEMLDSAVQAGFDDKNTEFLYMDNSSGNRFDGFSGINRAIIEAKGRYLVFCHQDVLFCFDKKSVLDKCLKELDENDIKWAVAGNAGKNKYGQSKVRITDPNTLEVDCGDFPEKVMSLDENFIVINLNNYNFCSQNLQGFHFYAVDFCLNAINNGLSCYAIRFHLLHKSGGKIDDSYMRSMNSFIEIHSSRKRTHIVYTMCLSFFVSSSWIARVLFNKSWAYKRAEKLFKKVLNKSL